jgi:hypothetical protein
LPTDALSDIHSEEHGGLLMKIVHSKTGEHGRLFKLGYLDSWIIEIEEWMTTFSYLQNESISGGLRLIRIHYIWWCRWLLWLRWWLLWLQWWWWWWWLWLWLLAGRIILLMQIILVSLYKSATFITESMVIRMIITDIFSALINNKTEI